MQLPSRYVRPSPRNVPNTQCLSSTQVSNATLCIDVNNFGVDIRNLSLIFASLVLLLKYLSYYSLIFIFHTNIYLSD